MYEINILSSKEFEDLPKSATRGSDISDSLGFANPYTNKVYVRRVAWDDLQAYLIDHELEHLMEEHKTDVDENGICHKKGGFFHNLINLALPFIGPAIQGDRAVFKTGLTNLGNQAVGAGEGFIGSGGNPLGAIFGAAKSGLSGTGPFGQKPGGAPNIFGGPTGMNSLFPSSAVSSASFNPGFGQSGAPASATLGPNSSGSAFGLGNNMGLGQAGISFGGGNIEQQMQQRNASGSQAGGYYPNYGQSGLLRF